MVYLADDDRDDLEFVQEALLQYSYKGPVNTASNGQMLIDLLMDQKSKNPDVIVLDLNMPLKDGYQALREIKQNPLLKNIPIIVLTASSNKQDEIRCLELGCNYFFTKPSRLDDYHSLVSVVKKFTVPQHM